MSIGSLQSQEVSASTAYVLALVNQVLETEKTKIDIPWVHPDSDETGFIVVERTHYRGDTPCRDYKRTTELPGSSFEVIRGTGCRVGPGNWELEERPAEMIRPGGVATRSASLPPPITSEAPETAPSAAPSGEAEAAGSPTSDSSEPARAASPEPATPDASSTLAEASEPTPVMPEFTMPTKSQL